MGKKSFIGFIYDQLCTVPPVVNADLTGKTVIVIGANTGLGFEATKHFVRMGAEKVVMACRSREKGEAALKRVEAETGHNTAELWLVDLCDLNSVKAFVDRAVNELVRLDILVLNAGVVPNKKYTCTGDGYETVLQVNNISQSLLALLLLPKVLETARKHNVTPRIVVVTSETHFRATLEKKVLETPNKFELLGSEEYCTTQMMKVRYRDSKLLNIFFVRALSSHLGDQPVIVDTVNPGFCISEIRRDMSNPLVWLLEKLVARTTEEGSRQLIWAALGGDEDKERLKGGYVSFAQVDEPSDYVLGEEGKKREELLWHDLLGLLEKIDPRVGVIVRDCLTTA